MGRGEERTREGVKPEGGRWEVELEVEGVELFSWGEFGLGFGVRHEGREWGWG